MQDRWLQTICIMSSDTMVKKRWYLKHFLCRNLLTRAATIGQERSLQTVGSLIQSSGSITIDATLVLEAEKYTPPPPPSIRSENFSYTPPCHGATYRGLGIRIRMWLRGAMPRVRHINMSIVSHLTTSPPLPSTSYSCPHPTLAHTYSETRRAFAARSRTPCGWGEKAFLLGR